MKKIKDLKNKSVVELKKEVVASKKELVALRMQHARNMLKNPILIREKRRFVARMQTLITTKNAEVTNA
ncbi:MAG: 50S ribosomal protein L29 [Alphaproteobacteria bacterium]|nr:50S ribosomal protein L29 [Alphaproteobacteria bacterium]